VTRIVLATRNPGKIVEVRRILADALGDPSSGGSTSDRMPADRELPIALVGLDSFPDLADVAETGATFADNALLKARAAASGIGLPAIADDSGIAVQALNGMPGVLSARWAGRHGDDDANLDLLLAQLADVPDERRDAAFVCVAALVRPGGAERWVEGRVAGRLLRERRGSGGFGYDPIFVPDGHTRTTAEMSPADKDALSHRGRAFRALAPYVVEPR
jgi:XTP/dITP diphosphohydrolase